MKAASLFSGIGGGEIAAHRAGIETIWYAENDPYPASIMAYRYPQLPNLGDVKGIHSETVERPDLLIGGFPCQDISVANKDRTGLAGKRSGLWFEFARLVGELTPQWLLIENVPGLLSSNGGRDLGTILGTLGNFGYSVAYRVLDAQYFGIPQRRRRVFLVGHLGDDWRSPATVLFEPESGGGNTPQERKAGQEIAHSLRASPRGVDEPTGTTYVVGHYWDGGQISDTLDSAMLKKGQMMPEKRRFPAVISGISHDYSLLDDTAPAITQSNSGASGRPHVVAQNVALRGRDSGATAELGDERATALRSSQGGGDKNHVLYTNRQSIVRRLTPLECERLQGFPDNWTQYGIRDEKQVAISNTRRYQALGNAFPVPVVEWILKRLVQVERGKNA